MTMTQRAVRLLRLLLVLLFAMAVVGQVLSWPGQLAHVAEEEPALAHLRWPFTVVAVLGLVCVEIVIVCVWRLLTMVTSDRIFSRAAFGWVDGIVWAVAAAWVLLLAGSAAVVVTVLTTPDLRDPGLPMALAGLGLVASVVLLLTVVLRALLRQAAALRTDLDGVI